MNGISGALPLDEAVEIAWMLVKLGRAVHPSKWVDDLIGDTQRSTFEAGAC